jgi:ketosteroid isomerase-like protein
MKVEQIPVTGKEEKSHLSAPMIALSEFYEALNSRDMRKMAKNWAQTDDAVMDNPVGGIKRGWEEIRAVYERIFNSPGQYWFEFYDYSYHEAGEAFYVVRLGVYVAATSEFTEHAKVADAASRCLRRRGVEYGNQDD